MKIEFSSSQAYIKPNSLRQPYDQVTTGGIISKLKNTNTSAKAQGIPIAKMRTRIIKENLFALGNFLKSNRLSDKT